VKSAASADELSSVGESIRVTLASGIGEVTWGTTLGLNAWYNVASKTFAWDTSNGAPGNFSHNGKGTVTVAKAGTYLIQEVSRVYQNVDSNAVGVFCPYINGTPQCATRNDDVGYRKGSYWYSNSNEGVYSLPAGATVSYGFYVSSDWAGYW